MTGRSEAKQSGVKPDDAHNNEVGMQAIIGVMIGAYIIAQMMEIVVTAPATNHGKALKGVAILVGIVGAIGMFRILYMA